MREEGEESEEEKGNESEEEDGFVGHVHLWCDHAESIRASIAHALAHKGVQVVVEMGSPAQDAADADPDQRWGVYCTGYAVRRVL